jgi:hypothetical protein
MEKIKISNNAFVYPMPMTVVGTMVDGRSTIWQWRGLVG